MQKPLQRGWGHAHSPDDGFCLGRGTRCEGGFTLGRGGPGRTGVLSLSNGSQAMMKRSLSARFTVKVTRMRCAFGSAIFMAPFHGVSLWSGNAAASVAMAASV